ncbi:hypothetical protein [Chryseobacterium sp. Marseille-Q3244]|uniref:hypothetical protein n=1 Tax=Chryseobacterium sp. Marseille-Q3244 TaxID=2758092 RepID=UPI002023CF5A|nr:hypothetical protein [Chryseobacterium sp. Marseille-Q3244]
MKLKLYIFIISILISLKIDGQAYWGKTNDLRNMPWNNTVINNANISGFIKSKGESSINHAFGSFNLNIPIYSIDEKIGISLAYSPSIVKPNEHPTETGLGWNLIAGGAIVREQKLMVDEIYVKLPSGSGHYGGFFRRGPFFTSGQGAWGSEVTAYRWGVHDAWESPDIFHFNFLGYSGSFMIDENGKWNVTSDSDFKIEHVVDKFQNLPLFNDLGNYDTLTRFKLTAADGTVFIFGGDQSSIDYIANNSVREPLGFPVSATKWYLTQIKFPDGNIIDFNYKRTDPQLKINIIFEYLSKYHKKAIPWFSNVSVAYPTYINSIKKNNIELVSFYYKNSVQKKYWDSVIPNFPEGYPWADLSKMNLRNYEWKTWFLINSYDDIKWNQLDKITIQPLKIDYIFNYTNNLNERLKLLGITKKYNSSSQNIAVKDENYTLAYNSKLLPEYWDGHGDHLGYNNGKSYNFVFSNNILINRSVSEAASIYETSRAPDTTGEFLYAELLTSVKYPNGEVTKYEYEPHSVSHTIALGGGIHPNSPIAYSNPGGFRLKSISYYDNDIFIKKKSLKYQKFYSKDYPNYLSSGIMSSLPRYYEDLKLTDIVKTQYYNAPLSIFTSNGLHQGSNTNGNYVLYSKVYEVDESVNGENMGYTQLQFSNYDFDRWGESHIDELAIGILNTSYHPDTPLRESFGRKNDSYYNPITSNQIQRGKLLERKVYNSNGELLKENNYRYKKIGDSYTKQFALFRTSDTRGQENEWMAFQTFLLGGFYKGYNYKYLLGEENEINYFENDKSVSTKKTYTYSPNYPNNLMSTKQETNTGEVSTDYKYAVDQNNQAMIDNNMIKIPLVQETKKDNQLTYKHEVIYGKDESTNNLLLPKEIHYFDKNNVVSDKAFIDLYDNKGNIVQYRESEYGLPITVIWGYNKVHPIMKIEGATYEQVKDWVESSLIISNELAKVYHPQYHKMLVDDLKGMPNKPSLKQFRITGFTYDYLAGVTSVIEPNGTVKTYEYDKANRLVNIFNNNAELLKNFKYNYKN